MFHGVRIPQIIYNNDYHRSDDYYLERKRRSVVWVWIDCIRFVEVWCSKL